MTYSEEMVESLVSEAERITRTRDTQIAHNQYVHGLEAENKKLRRAIRELGLVVNDDGSQ